MTPLSSRLRQSETFVNLTLKKKRSAREAKSSIERKELIRNQLENDQIVFDDDYLDFDYESLPEHYWNMEYEEAKET